MFAGITKYLPTAQSVEEIGEWSSFKKPPPPFRFDTFLSFPSGSEHVACATVLQLASCPLCSHVLSIPWLAPGLMSSCGKHSQELLSVHGARHRDCPPDR